uniref:Uncharacterized protein n=1 Tax=Anguilla anguilla TaxID=7936 RepID=A0A0E9TV99_ANGAN
MVAASTINYHCSIYGFLTPNVPLGRRVI